MATPASSASASSSVVGEWKLGEGAGTVAVDSSGNGDTGALSGGLTWVPGRSGSALRFDANGGQVRVPENPILAPQSAVSVSVWVNAAGSPGAYRYIVAKGANGCIAASYGLYSGPDGGLDFYVSQQRGSVYARSPDAGTGVWDGGWHLVVGTYDGGTIRLYVDGAQIGSGTAYPGQLEYLLPDSNDLFIGNYPGCAAHEFLGVIDDVAVYDQALSADEVKALLSVGAGGLPPPTPPGGGSDGPGAGGGTAGTPSAGGDQPAIQRGRLSSATLTFGSGGPLGQSDSQTGATISFTETQAARLTVRVLRSQRGVRKGGRCVTPARRDHGRRLTRCTHFVVIDSYVRAGPAGHTVLPVNALLRHRLSPGSYRLELTPRARGRTGRTVRVAFVIRRRHI